MSKKEPCPLCGKAPELLFAGFTRLKCSCGISFSTGERSSIKLLKLWNHRPEPAQEFLTNKIGEN